MLAADDHSIPAIRTWRPAALWTAGILLAAGLAWFVGAAAVPLARTRKVVAGQVGKSFDPAVAIPKLGGKERAAGSLALYYRLPARFAPYKETSVMLLAECGEVAIPVLRQALGDRDDRVRLAALLGLIRLQAVGGVRPADLNEWALLNDGVRLASADVTGRNKDLLLETDHSGNSGGTTHFLITRLGDGSLELIHKCWTVYYASRVNYRPGRIVYDEGVVTPFQIAVQTSTFHHVMELEWDGRGFRLARESVEGKPLLDQSPKAAAELRAVQAAFEKGGCAWRGDPVSVARRSCIAGAGEPDTAKYAVGFRSDSLAMVLRKPVEPVQPPEPLPDSGFSDGRERIFVYRPFFAELGTKSIWAASEEGMIGERIMRD